MQFVFLKTLYMKLEFKNSKAQIKPNLICDLRKSARA